MYCNVNLTKLSLRVLGGLGYKGALHRQMTNRAV